jgi:hypothetical protein
MVSERMMRGFYMQGKELVIETGGRGGLKLKFPLTVFI